jgi:hypothetical protein
MPIVRCSPCVGNAFANCNVIGESLWVTMLVNKRKLFFLLDSGSQLSLMVDNLGQTLNPTDMTLYTASCKPLIMSGCADYDVELGRTKIVHKMFVSKELGGNVLGTDFLVSTKCVIDLQKMRLKGKSFNVPVYTQNQKAMIQTIVTLSPTLIQIPEVVRAQFVNLPENYRDSAKVMFERYPQIFQPLGTSKNFEHEIVLKYTGCVDEPTWFKTFCCSRSSFRISSNTNEGI